MSPVAGVGAAGPSEPTTTTTTRGGGGGGGSHDVGRGGGGGGGGGLGYELGHVLVWVLAQRHDAQLS